MATLTCAVFAEGDLFVARCLDVEVASQGTSVEEALANLHEALELYYDDSTPPPTTVVDVRTMEIRGGGS